MNPSVFSWQEMGRATPVIVPDSSHNSAKADSKSHVQNSAGVNVFWFLGGFEASQRAREVSAPNRIFSCTMFSVTRAGGLTGGSG